jgi:hypothetical protein
MPRFYFHIEDDRTHIDHVGVELSDLQAARDEAVSAAGQILRNGAAKALWSGKPWRMWVTQSPYLVGFYDRKFAGVTPVRGRALCR